MGSQTSGILPRIQSKRGALGIVLSTSYTLTLHFNDSLIPLKWAKWVEKGIVRWRKPDYPGTHRLRADRLRGWSRWIDRWLYCDRTLPASPNCRRVHLYFSRRRKLKIGICYSRAGDSLRWGKNPGDLQVVSTRILHPMPFFSWIIQTPHSFQCIAMENSDKSMRNMGRRHESTRHESSRHFNPVLG